jgi:excisionase family DNA binding protein
MVTNVQTAHIDLQAAADRLGVHYQTAYRWVRSGRLPATLVSGRYLVDERDLEAVSAARAMPSTPTAPTPARLDRSAERMYDALVAGDEPAASKLARRLADEGTPVVELLQHVIVPPLRRIGQGWHDGEITIWAEHRAAAIVGRILGLLAPNPRGRRRGVAVVAALSGDHHSLPTAMATVALRDDNWHVHHLGADIPAEEIERFCNDHDVAIAVLTVTNPDVRAVADETAARLRRAGIPTLVGGAGRTLDDLVTMARAAGAGRP